MFSQQDFTKLYDTLLGFAYAKAGRYFRDRVQREDAAAEAVNDAIDWWINDGNYDEETAKRTIKSSLRQASRKRELEPINVVGEEYEGMHGYKII